MKVVCLAVATIGISALFSASDCHAYLDPSSGGWLYQMFFPVIVAISGSWVLARRHIIHFWHKFMFKWQREHLTKTLKSHLSSKNIRLNIMLPVVIVGAFLPVEFLSEANGYLGYMRAWELFPVFGWQWLFYAFTGLVTSLLIIFSIRLMAKLFNFQAETMVGRIVPWLSVLLVMLSMLRGARLWFGTSSYSSVTLPSINWITVVLTGAICAFVIKRYAHLAYNLIGLVQFTALVGLVLTLIAPVVTWTQSPVEGVLPKINNAGNRAKRPNIVLITVDALTANHMSLYGYNRATTPNLELLSKEADVYDRFYANSNITTSSVNSILHGVRPWTHRAVQLPAMPLISVAREGLVGRLKAAGYKTTAVATNRFAAPYTNLTKQYFDKVAYGQINRLSARIGIILTIFPHIHPLFRELIKDQPVDEYIDRLLIHAGVYTWTDHYDPERAFSHLRGMIQTGRTDQPIFSWIHLYPPHSPYASPPPFLGVFDSSSRHRTRDDSTPPWCYLAAADKTFPDEYVGRYDESIAYVDSHIGRFIDWLKTQGVYDDALIVITADHGESFSHGYGDHSGPAMHEDLIHVPLIIKEPRQRAGRRISFLSEQIDLMPTMLDYAGLPTAVKGEGVSIRNSVSLEKMGKPIFSMNFQQSYCFGELNTGTVVMIDGDWKYVHYFGDIQYPMMPELVDSLYNLRSDPGENVNLVTVQSAIAKQMLAAIERQLQIHGGSVE